MDKRLGCMVSKLRAGALTGPGFYPLPLFTALVAPALAVSNLDMVEHGVLCPFSPARPVMGSEAGKPSAPKANGPDRRGLYSSPAGPFSPSMPKPVFRECFSVGTLRRNGGRCQVPTVKEQERGQVHRPSVRVFPVFAAQAQGWIK